MLAVLLLMCGDERSVGVLCVGNRTVERCFVSRRNRESAPRPSSAAAERESREIPASRTYY